MKKLISCFSLFLLAINFLTAQVNEQLFSDPDSRTGGIVSCQLKYNNTMIIGGRTFDKSKYMPSVMCVDTSGNVLWNTATYDLSTYSGDGMVYRIMLDSLGFLYAASYENTFGQMEYWKIDPATGTIIWKHNAVMPYNMTTFLIDYDSTRFITSHQSITGSPIYRKVCFIDKSTGDTTSTHLLFSNTSTLPYSVCVDPLKNIYFSNIDSVVKLDANNLSNRIWAVSHVSSQVAYQSFYYDDATSSVIGIGYRHVFPYHTPKINKINASTGALTTEFTGTGDFNFKSFKILGSNLYVTWQHAYVGSGFFPMQCTKYNLATGSVTWNVSHIPVGVGSPGFPAGNSNTALALDLDNSGNIFLTGYYGDDNYGPGAWGILKLNSSGVKLYERTITMDTAFYDEKSQGTAACVINNTPYFFGELETESNINLLARSKVFFVKMANSTGNILIQKSIEGNLQFGSKTVAIKNYNSTQTLVLKHNGQYSLLEMLDYNKNILWSTKLSGGYFLFADKISVAPNGDIYIAGHSNQEINAFPYYWSVTDSLYLFHLNSSGNIISISRFDNPASNSYCTELYASNTKVLYVYQRSNFTYLRNWSAGLFGVEVNSGLQFNMQKSETKYSVDKDSTKALVFGTVSSGQVLTFNKVTSTFPFVSMVPAPIHKINYVLETDTNQVVLCSKNNLNRESMALYNTTTFDTIWTKALSSTTPSEVLKCVTDPSKNYIYSISSNSNNMVIRKLALTTGVQQWAYTYAGAAGLTDAPVDIVYDSNKDQIVIAGFESAASGDYSSVSLVLGIDGVPADSIIQPSEFPGHSVAYCAHILPDGTQWIGGNVNKAPGGPMGFIYEVGPTLTSGNYVWPGDADKTMLADNNDLLPIGVFYGATGPTRAFVSNAWTGYTSSDWGVLQASGVDIKHADCNGDGTINDSDTLAVIQNFSLTHAITAPSSDIRSALPDIYFQTSSTTYNAGDWVDAELWIGTTSSPAADFYGLAFNVAYDASIVETGSESLTYGSSWLGTPGTDVIKLAKISAPSNTVYGAEVRTNHLNVDGFGKIANFKFRVSTTISANDTMDLNLSFINAIDSAGTSIGLNVLPLTLNFLAPLSVEEVANTSGVKIFPNPFSDHLNIQFQNDQKGTVVHLTDLLGRELNKSVVDGKELRIQKNNLLPGVYFLNIAETGLRTKTVKVIVQ